MVGPDIVLLWRKPARKEVIFITVENETGMANLILRPNRFAIRRRLVLSAGRSRQGVVVHVVTDWLQPADPVTTSSCTSRDPKLHHDRGR